MTTLTNKLKREDLYSLEKYTEIRDDFRKKMIKHKENRRLELGEHVLLLFEDKLIMQYQVQEMLKAEKIFDAAGIEEELATYNPLIPDGNNWKATMMIQYTDVDERHRMLSKLIGIETQVWIQVADYNKIYAIADEDLQRDTVERTSAVHFLRFELSREMVTAARTDAAISAGVNHVNYSASVNPLPVNITTSLRQDLQ